MLSTAIIWTLLPWTLHHQTPLCPDNNMIHPTNTVRNPTLSLGWVARSIQATLGLTYPLGTCQPATHTYRGVATAYRTVTTLCDALATSKFPTQRRTHAHNYAGKHHHDSAAGDFHIQWIILLNARGLVHGHQNHHWHFNKEPCSSSWGQNMWFNQHCHLQGPVSRQTLKH